MKTFDAKQSVKIAEGICYGESYLIGVSINSFQITISMHVDIGQDNVEYFPNDTRAYLNLIFKKPFEVVMDLSIGTIADTIHDGDFSGADIGILYNNSVMVPRSWNKVNDGSFSRIEIEYSHGKISFGFETFFIQKIDPLSLNAENLFY